MAKFERKFVFLSPEDKGYEIAIGKKPRGHIEIERKGERISFKVFIENLREMIYEVQLFTFGGNYVILDEISIGKSGKQEGKYNANSSNVLNSGIRWQEFDVVVIRPQGQEHSRKVPLVAWLNNSKEGKGDIPFIENRFMEDVQEHQLKNEGSLEIQDELDAKQIASEDFLAQPKGEEIDEWKEDVEDPEEFIEESMEDFTEELTEPSIEEDFQEEIFIEQELNEDYEEILDEEEPNKEEIIDQEAEYPGNEDYEVNYDNEIHYYYVNQNIQELEKLVPEISPFYPPIKNHRWWEMKEDQEGLDGFYLYFNDSFVDIRYPYMGYKNIEKAHEGKYRNKIFGIVYNDEMESQLGYFVYGIPGRLCLQEQPFQGNTGFLYWHPSEGSQNAEGEMGYWLLYVEAHSGIVAIPKRPTTPPDCQE